jgi:Lon protease-like protein
LNPPLAPRDNPAGSLASLPLFPLQTVLFPEGLLSLKVFEVRYLDLVSACLRTNSPFGVVCLERGAEAQRAGAPAVRLEPVGVLAELIDVDAETAGILQVRCVGGLRFDLGATRQLANGLLVADASLRGADAVVAPDASQEATVRALGAAIEALAARGTHPFREPFRFDDAGWVANRWCEILPISLAAKQRLMELDDGETRLKLVGEFLRGKGVV